MNRMLTLGGLVLAAGLFGCQSQQQLVDQMQGDAQMTAQRRGAFELNCPAAQATLLSKEMMQTGMSGAPMLGWQPAQRAEYTYGVSGCGKQATYLVICAVGGTGCVAGGSRSDTPQQQ